MDAINWVAIVGAAAWMPQIFSWVNRAFRKPKISIHLHSQPQIGYDIYGPIFNVTSALLSEKKDAILNKISVTLKHESGASYTFDWAGLSEDIGEIEYTIGGQIMSMKKTVLPLVVKVLHAGVAQVFVRFRHESFKANTKKTFDAAVDRFNLLKKTEKLKTEQDIEDLITEKEFDKVIKLLNSEFIWSAGIYTVTFEFQSPNKFKYKKSEYTFELSQDDIDNLRKNIDNIKHDMIERAKLETISGYKRKDITWIWRFPELQRKDT